ncbi:class I SAM-dependent methyltransferase [Desulfovibrio sp. OttesenSCG-928-A18]|nr:class I SAM-dependent methyltransferase [Desulfovibrio sp. OttesenSCG-928-A18]
MKNKTKRTKSAIRIEELAKLNSATRYLEIGVFKGETFLDLQFPLMVGVDPDFQFDIEANKREGKYFIPETSDSFFKKLAEGHEAVKGIAGHFGDDGIKFDLIFIDGWHSYDQSLRDFENSLLFAHDKTIWILDDSIPQNPYASVDDYGKSLQYSNKVGVYNKAGNGHVYQTVLTIHDKYPDFSYCTLLADKYQTVVWKAPGGKRTPVCNSPEEIKSIDYFDMLNYAPQFMIESDDSYLELVGKINTPAKYDVPDAWERLLFSKVETMRERELLETVRKNPLLRLVARLHGIRT